MRVCLGCLLFIQLAGCLALPVENNPAGVELAGERELPEISFAPGQVFGQAQSWDIVSGDLDRDGSLDLVIAALGSDEPKIWINDGEGALTPSGQDLPGCFRVGIADLNGDSTLDLVLAEWKDQDRLGSDTFSIWLNDGEGSFTPGDRIQTASQTQGLILGDFNGDRAQDLFLFGQIENQIWFNQGDGTFWDSGQRLLTGLDAAAAAGDLDEDGDLDLITGGWDGLPAVWFNDGRGFFQRADLDFAETDLHIHGLAVGDLDGDGDLDAAADLANRGPHQVWINDGSGGFSLHFMLDGILGHDLGLGDLDRDGDLDLVTAHGRQSSGHLRIWINLGNGSFESPGVSYGEAFTAGVALADLDQDGFLDLIAAQNRWGADSGPPDQVWINRGCCQDNSSP